MFSNKADVLNLINTQMKAVLKKQSELAGDAFATNVGFDVMRQRYIEERRFWNEGGPVMAKIHDDVVESFDGSSIPVRYYYPSTASCDSPLPAIEYIHGGGFVVGSIDTHDRITRMLAHETGAVVVSVDYPLSPEAKFPKALEACVAVAAYLHEHGDKHGILPNDISFAGDSGGANLSLASFLYLRDEMEDASFIKTMLLYYGMYGLKDSCGYRLYGGSWDGLDASDMEYYLDCYCADKEKDLQSPYLNCLSADLTKHVAPCYIASAEYDPLIDDSRTLHRMLQIHGMTSEYEEFKGVIHAFLHHTRMLDEAQRALDHGASFFRRQHTHYLAK